MSLPGDGRDGGSSRRRIMADSLAASQAESTGTASSEAPAVLERAPGAGDSLESLPFWFHRDHGAEAGALEPKEEVLIDGSHSVAQAFVAENFPADSDGGPESEQALQEMLGIRCHLDGAQNQLLAQGTGDGPPFGVPLMFAEVSCASVPLVLAPGQLPPMLIFAVIPSAGEMLNRGEKVQEGSRTVWYFLSQDVELRADILDIFSLCGCVRRDLNEAYRSSVPDQILLIGEGAYARVHAMAHRTGKTMAVKKINAGVQVKSILNEISTHLQVHDHTNIIGFRGLFYAYEKDTLRLSAVFDLALQGDLLYRVMRYDAMSETAARPLFRGILSALAYIHQHQIVHRDIKAENVLLMEEAHAAVADFGLAARMSDTSEMARRCGSPGYVACEVCLGQPYGAKVDSFSAGVVLYFMLSQEMPFSSPDHDTARTMQRTVKCNLHLQNPPWSGMSSRLRNILRSLICKNQNQRLSSEAAMEHPWFNIPEQPAPQQVWQPEPPAALGPIAEGSYLPDMANGGNEAFHPGYAAAPGAYHQPAPPGRADDRRGQDYSQPYAGHVAGQPYPVGLISPPVHACAQYPAAGYPHAAGTPDVAYGAAAHAAGSHPPGSHAAGGYAPGCHPPGNLTGGHAAGSTTPGSHAAGMLGAGSHVAGPGAGYAADPET